MKTLKFFTFAAMALSMSFVASCSDDGPDAAPNEIQRGDQACRIETFMLNLPDGTQIKGDVYDYDHSIDITYTTPDQDDSVAMATAVVTLAEGATITPDPSIALDYTQPQAFTVTAPDGMTTCTYKTHPIAKEAGTLGEPYTKVSLLTMVGAADLGITPDDTAIGISGTDVVIGHKVYDGKTLAPKGDLNVTGIAISGNDKIVWFANDDIGTLIGSTSDNGGYEKTTNNAIWIWKDGWNAAPVALLGPTSGAYLSGHISAIGNLKTGLARVVASNEGGGSDGRHMIWSFVDGVRINETGNFNLKTGITAIWAQMASLATTDIAGPWFVYSGVTGSDGNNASRALTFSGWDGNPDVAPADMVDFQGDTGSGPDYGFGNYNMGSVRAFTFNGTPMAAFVSTSWPSTYISIVDTEGNFLLTPAAGAYSNSTKPADFGKAPQVTYIYDTSDGCGYVYVNEYTYGVTVYKLEIAYR